ncbi:MULTISPECIES: single-stranded-DNA-specific exonuclease RecJ [Rhodanobacter]|uniref:single-stranded-DNA-specific exonuclease RecJ n=1 Tax=Rhodanobacter TaxID=75309 RepID=UPI00041AB68E|nr:MULTISPECIES: single-stranded-DNA-specific exonuclease RecJ [Rhodanobacter]KZC20426.1 single-stranded-DNA-specific exonuclease RecJ [Rhodanobacter denitrificans]UJJ52639.1 single-stranded-DNA-specific exonuclease RecJ [Rhodanobacter denitrificans]UJM95393.1 single-stranded-DNA-specific exonuclease RecJ [Rhodanobacter denitrificans]UJM98924.1 single-stranded-DNA-specific exonuclease RecJ [Rhodanobacter denitrificans]UJN21661.1 single-stranded-DNA-specific exonuclease RecJ [Rhodanobacter deni
MSVLQLRRREGRGAPHGWADAVHPVLQQIYAARGVLEPGQVEHRLARMLSPQLLGGMAPAVDLLVEAIRDDWTILIAGDYDCDGATGAAVAVRGLRLLGARRVDYAIPNRFAHGYGLSPAFVASLQPTPQLIVTVDNGVASVAGVAAAKARGIRVIVTDHHLPGEQLPACDAMVNPNLPGDGFPSKALAGVGVVFYLLLALRGRMRERGVFAGAEPDLSGLLDLVALGTVADLVPLDFNNRVLVEAGLQRMRSGRGCAGIAALVEAGKRSLATLCSTDLAFAVGPRLNAAGRLEDMRLGVECLLTDDVAQARRHAEQLDAINRERRELQASMVAEAEVMVAGLGHVDAVGVALFEPSWHAGVVGLVASKLKERLHRPVIAFAPAGEDDTENLRGSARSIPGFHIRDALAAIDARQPGLIERFGGHAMAAGLSLRSADYPRFAAAFDAIARELIEPERLQAVLYTDGELPPGAATLGLARQLRAAGPWGQAFPEPLFDNLFDCAGWKLMGESHLRLQLRDPRDGALHDAVMFNAYHGQPPPSRLRAVYELTINDWQGRETPRLLLRHIEPA